MAQIFDSFIIYDADQNEIYRHEYSGYDEYHDYQYNENTGYYECPDCGDSL